MTELKSLLLRKIIGYIIFLSFKAIILNTQITLRKGKYGIYDSFTLFQLKGHHKYEGFLSMPDSESIPSVLSKGRYLQDRHSCNVRLFIVTASSNVITHPNKVYLGG